MNSLRTSLLKENKLELLNVKNYCTFDVFRFWRSLKLLETSGNFWKVSWKLPETSKQCAGGGNFQTTDLSLDIQDFYNFRDLQNFQEIQEKARDFHRSKPYPEAR